VLNNALKRTLHTTSFKGVTKDWGFC
jgi:hypothetical protein